MAQCILTFQFSYKLLGPLPINFFKNIKLHKLFQHKSIITKGFICECSHACFCVRLKTTDEYEYRDYIHHLKVDDFIKDYDIEYNINYINHEE